MLLDLGASSPDDVRPALEPFVRSGLTTVASTRSALERGRRRGRRGVAPLEAALALVGPVVTDSELESAMRALFRSAGIDGWVFHAVIEGYETDFAFARHRVVVEVDGWEHHGASRRGWERDRERDLVLAALGWQVVHLTWRMVTRTPAACVARLRAAFAHRETTRPGARR